MKALSVVFHALRFNVIDARAVPSITKCDVDLRKEVCADSLCHAECERTKYCTSFPSLGVHTEMGRRSIWTVCSRNDCRNVPTWHTSKKAESAMPSMLETLSVPTRHVSIQAETFNVLTTHVATQTERAPDAVHARWAVDANNSALEHYTIGNSTVDLVLYTTRELVDT